MHGSGHVLITWCDRLKLKPVVRSWPPIAMIRASRTGMRIDVVGAVSDVVGAESAAMPARVMER
jgi:hypothetical protein